MNACGFLEAVHQEAKDLVWAASQLGVGIGEGSEKKPRRDWKGLLGGEVGIGPLVYSHSPMVLEGENECPRVSGLLQTCLFSFSMSLVVRKDNVLRRGQEDRSRY